ncbi:histidine kinase [Pseudoalteromonas sp. HM-SA03]|uniref:histidine kinase n=1 Tax=Pseudoalteromonas sp. HM-SA03 TaxID=2029678 RepID=UPI000BAE5FCC|nr:histidine kinase [Pseudoalteromonas sp. HM-SA03]PAY01560.1 histidine kinase [Pseudoalteromonas sp. HM-SA03]
MMQHGQGELAKLVHDARKPLNQISMNSELIKLIAEQPDSQQQIIEVANAIIKATKECSELLQMLVEQGNNE